MTTKSTAIQMRGGRVYAAIQLINERARACAIQLSVPVEAGVLWTYYPQGCIHNCAT